MTPLAAWQPATSFQSGCLESNASIVGQLTQLENLGALPVARPLARHNPPHAPGVVMWSCMEKKSAPIAVLPLPVNKIKAPGFARTCHLY